MRSNLLLICSLLLLLAAGCSFELRAPPAFCGGDCDLPGADGSAGGDAVGGGDLVGGDGGDSVVGGDQVGPGDGGAGYFNITWPTVNPYRTSTTPIRVSGNCSTNVSIVSLGSGTFGTWIDGDCSDGTWELDVDLAPGANTVQLIGQIVGIATISLSHTVNYDNEAEIAITAPNNGIDFATTSRGVVVSGTCDSDIISIQTPASGILKSNDCATIGSWAFEATPLSPGFNRFEVLATDDLGNVSSTIGMTITRLDAGGRTRVQQIVTGDAHSCALLADGQVFCWGSNESGQIGDGSGDVAPRAIPVQVDTGPLNGSERFVQITAGSRHTCGIVADGGVACWGDNFYGQLGVGDVAPHSDLVEVQLGNFGGKLAQISAGGTHTCGVTFAGMVACWGSNANGQLGNGISSTITDGQVGGVDPSPAAVNQTFTQVAAGYDHTCALTGGGEVLCWGANSNGQVGRGNTSPPVVSPTAIDSTNVPVAVAITAGSGHTCAVAADGHAYCWGGNSSGQLGKHPGSYAMSPVHVDAVGPLYRQLSAGENHTCGITDAGVAHCWGNGGSGRLGDGSTAGYLNPVPVDVTGLPRPHAFRMVAAGATHSCGISADGIAMCWGSRTGGRLGSTGLSGVAPTPVFVDTETFPTARVFSQLTVGLEHACALDDAGIGFCWGSNSTGQLGIASSQDSHQTPERLWETQLMGEGRLRDISAGNQHTCAVSWDGRMFCWGNNTNGELGRGDISTPINAPRPLPPVATSGSTYWQQVAAGGSTSCGIMGDGVLFCWGADNRGQVGDGPPIGGTVPLPTTLWIAGHVGATQHIGVGVGAEHTCASAADGVAYCWGSQDDGALGQGSTSDQTDRPQLVDTSNISTTSGESRRGVAGGLRFSCAVSTMGNASCWGDNGHGQVGAGSDTTPHPIPTAVSNGGVASPWLQLTAGTDHACGRRANGSGYCWGSNAAGQIGRNVSGGSDLKAPEPVLTDNLDGEEFWIEIDAGGATSCGRTAEGLLYCWGNNTSGQTGTSTGSPALLQPTAVDVSGL